MKNVQTELNEAEYRLLTDYAERRGKSIKEALREAALKLVLSDTVGPDDPLFNEPPAARRTGKRENTAKEHDKFLYGVSR
jgi:hypothetical protein